MRSSPSVIASRTPLEYPIPITIAINCHPEGSHPLLSRTTSTDGRSSAVSFAGDFSPVSPSSVEPSLLHPRSLSRASTDKAISVRTLTLCLIMVQQDPWKEKRKIHGRRSTRTGEGLSPCRSCSRSTECAAACPCLLSPSRRHITAGDCCFQCLYEYVGFCVDYQMKEAGGTAAFNTADRETGGRTTAVQSLRCLPNSCNKVCKE